jgi:beta-N-acetylhexosaminidase
MMVASARTILAVVPSRRNQVTVRRRQLSVLAAAAVALALGLVIGARAGSDPRPQSSAAPVATAGTARPPAAHKPAPKKRVAAVDRLSLARQVGKLVVLRFDGTEAPLYVRRILRRGQAAGAILFHDNVASPPQLQALTRALRAAGRAGGATPIVCTDQEGGPIRTLAWAPPVAAQAAQRPGPDALAAGRALRADGVNVALAPVADVPSVADAALASRAYSSDSARTADAVGAAVRGWRRAGVAPTAKHFPGLGGTAVNTDHGSTMIAGGAPTDADLAPFRAAIAAGVPLVMTSNAVYPALDPDHIAAQSPAVIDDLLRDRLGFKGVVITDSIEAAAVRATGTVEQVAVRSIAAGDDIVLTTGHGSWVRVYRALLAQARASSAFRARVRASAARVIDLQAALR